MYLHIYIKNGFYVPTLFWFMLIFSNDLFLSSFIALKVFSANYWYHYGRLFDYNIPKQCNWLKQFVRFTDTGHLASFLYYCFPSFYPVAFNVHYSITFAYWISIRFLGMKDLDEKVDDSIIQPIHDTHETLNHSLPWVLLVFEYAQKRPCIECFNNESLYYSYMWLYAWFFFAYLPWRFITGDSIYSILDSKASYKTLGASVLLLHGLIFFANMSGRGLMQIF